MIDAPIVTRVRDMFIADVNKLVDQNAAEIYLLMASPGGVVSVAQDMIAFMDKTRAERNVKFTTHNTAVVASAACYVFLAGQRRLSMPRGVFLFHEASLTTNGALTSQALQEASVKVQQIERSFLAMLTSKTKLTESEASSFTRCTVILSADEARRDGIIEATSGFSLPQGATILGIRARPNGTAPTPTPTPGG